MIVIDTKANPFVPGTDLSLAYEKGWKDAGGEQDSQPITLWKLLRKHGVGLYTAQMVCNEAMQNGVIIPLPSKERL